MNSETQIYFQWSFMALFGLNPVEADNFLCKNLDVIKQVSSQLLDKINYAPQEIYRGVILQNPIDELKPHENFTYLSFSESKDIASSFANPGPDGFGSLYHLGDYGYIIKHTPCKEEVIFHNKFIDILPYSNALLQLGFNDSTIREQKEVMIIQPELPFKNIKPYKNETH